MTAAAISGEFERRSSIPRDMTYLVHKGKVMSEKNTIKENNIEAEARIEMSLRLLGNFWKKWLMKIECPAKPNTHAFIHFVQEEKGTNFIRSTNMLKKNWEEGK